MVYGTGNKRTMAKHQGVASGGTIAGVTPIQEARITDGGIALYFMQTTGLAKANASSERGLACRDAQARCCDAYGRLIERGVL
jgi:hypothetical protein